MTVKNDWQNGDTFTADDANDVANDLNAATAALGASVKAVAVTTGSESRPITTGIVLWIGGETQPTNMVDGDLWFEES